jgi:hypothetical protein
MFDASEKRQGSGRDGLNDGGGIVAGMDFAMEATPRVRGGMLRRVEEQEARGSQLSSASTLSPISRIGGRTERPSFPYTELLENNSQDILHITAVSLAGDLR